MSPRDPEFHRLPKYIQARIYAEQGMGRPLIRRKLGLTRHCLYRYLTPGEYERHKKRVRERYRKGKKSTQGS